MIHKACMPVYMNSGKIVADGTGGTGGKIEGSTRGPRGPKKYCVTQLKLQNLDKLSSPIICCLSDEIFHEILGM